jgi:hypothetical protein
MSGATSATLSLITSAHGSRCTFTFRHDQQERRARLSCGPRDAALIRSENEPPSAYRSLLPRLYFSDTLVFVWYVAAPSGERRVNPFQPIHRGAQGAAIDNLRDSLLFLRDKQTVLSDGARRATAKAVAAFQRKIASRSAAATFAAAAVTVTVAAVWPAKTLQNRALS